MSINLTPSSNVFPSVTVQQLVFTAKRIGVVPTVTYVNGATAGSEVVTMDASYNITIQIQNGVSTNTQIAAALAASAQGNKNGPGDYCSAVPNGGHASDTPTCFSVALSGGVVVAKASLHIGPLVFTAHTAGTAGNSLQVIFTSGATAGSEVVTNPNSNGAPLTIQIADGVSTYEQVRVAIVAWQVANSTTYFDLSSTGQSLTRHAHVSDTASALSLTGGLAAAVAATGTVNGMAVAAKATGVAANGVKVTLIPGGTAGSEVVVDLGNGSFTCQIQSGTSTPTQVSAALNADTVFTASYTASHTGSTGMQAVFQNAMSGATGPTNMGFYMDSATTALTSSFQWMPFGNLMTSIQVENDDPSGSNTVIGSWDGVNTHFIIPANTARQFVGNTKNAMFLKFGTGAPAYRAWAVVR